MRSVGLDLGSRKTAYCIIEHGAVVERGTVAKVDELVDKLGPGTPPATVAFEACREAWYVHAVVTGWGQCAKMIDTTRVQRIGVGQHGRKNDRIDADAIAWATERRQIPEAHVLSVPRQKLRTELLTRRALVESRSQMVTAVRGIVRSEGLALPSCDTDHFVAMVRGRSLPSAVRAVVEPLLAVLAVTQQQLCVQDERIETLCAQEPATRLLMTVPGVALVVAAMFVSVIDQAKRFRSARQVGAYLGLVPRESSTGLKDQRLGSITKQGNRYLRALLIQSAWVVMRRTDDADPLVRWGRELAKRRGNRVAVVALARRLAGILWALWKRGVAYDPAHVAELSAEGLERSAQVTAAQAQSLRREMTKSAARATALKRRRSAAERLTTPTKALSH
jgi:transposase